MHSLRILLALGLASAALAAPVDADLAAAAARHWLAGRAADPGAPALHAVEGAGGPVLWLASFPQGGFVWLRGDDRLPPVAGWSEDGEIAWTVEHPALADWIELQRLDIEGARTLDWSDPAAGPAWEALADAPSEATARDARDVSPLLVSTWDQGWPWNQFCPEDGAGPGDHVWAGCVATAMGQVLYFWQRPAEGLGYHSYLHPVYGQQAVQYSGHVYDWEGMQPGSGTAAAATLLYHCAVAVNMDFAPDGSGAFVGTGQNSALHAFTSYFRYPDTAEFILRTEFPGDAWGARIREEIAAGRPVMHRGYGSGGHAFVLDGVQGDLFHLNWGWSGYYNGWFAIEALSPGGMDFSEGQGAIVNLAPNEPPTVAIPDQSVPSGAPFPPLELDQFVSDPQDSPDEILWWAEEDGPLGVDIDYLTRVATVTYPADWTGSATVLFNALDVDGEYTTVDVLFTVVDAVAGPAAAVDDLRLAWNAGGLDLCWTAPETDATGEGPAVIAGYEVHRSSAPWFAPGDESRVATLPAGTLVWRDDVRSLPGPCYYRVVVLGP